MSKINALRALLKAFSNQIVNKDKYNSNADTDVIVLASEAIGDNLVFIDVFNFIEEQDQKEGKRTIFICNKKMNTFWEANKKNNNTEIWSVDKQFSKDTFCCIDRVKKENIHRMILPMHHTLSVIISNCVKANEFYAMLYNEWIVNRPFYIKKLYSIGRKKVIDLEDGFFIGTAYEKLMNSIFQEEYSWGLPEICYNNKDIEYDDYIFFAPYSNLPERSLSNEQIIQIITFLINECNSKVILSGTSNDIQDAEIISQEINNTNLINLVGKTTFDEYLNLIAKARLVVGTDSGSIHYAASLGVESVVLAGLWSGAFLPYRTNKNGIFPKCIYTKQEFGCKYCLNKIGGIKSCNSKCFERIENGQRRLCLESISMDDVKQVLLAEL